MIDINRLKRTLTLNEDLKFKALFLFLKEEWIKKEYNELPFPFQQIEEWKTYRINSGWIFDTKTLTHIKDITLLRGITNG